MSPTMSASSSSQDWPLSKEEQKKRIMRLYDKDVQAANEIIHSTGEAALKQAIKEVLQQELKTAREKKKKPPELRHDRSDSKQEATLNLPKRSDRRSRWENHEHWDEPPSPIFTDDASEASEVDAAAQLQNVIVDAAGRLASLFGSSSLSSVLIGIAEGTDQDAAGTEKSEGRQRAKSEGCRVVAPEVREEQVDRRRRKSRGGAPLRVSWADEVEVEERRRPSIGEPEPSPSNSPREDNARETHRPAVSRPAAPASQALQGTGRGCVTRRSRRGRAPPSSAPSGMLDFI